MAVLAIPIHAVYECRRRIVMGEYPTTSVVGLLRDVDAARSVVIDDPIPLGGVRTLLCYTPGTFRWKRPVDPNTIVTVSIQVRKTADYDTDNPPAGTLGYREGGKMPYLRVTRADGYTLTDTMADVDDTWDTLSVAMPILAIGVLTIEASQIGTRGGNGLISPRLTLTQQATQPQPRCYWANLQAIAEATEPAITIAASTWRWDGVSGSVLVSSGIPLQPGNLTAANLATFRVFVGAPLVEQAVALDPLDGQFPDGSYRAVHVQYQYTLTHDTPVPAEIRINQGVRGTTDIAWTKPTLAVVQKKAVIEPTDPAYLCGTFVTLTPLTPASNDTGVAAIWAAGAVARWTGTTATGANPGGAIYDHQNGLLKMWCRTGDRIWYQWAYDWSCELLGGSVLHSGATSVQLLTYVLPSAGVLGTCANEDDWNPEALTGVNSSCGSPAEWYSLRWVSMASAYWMTGWRQPKRCLDRAVIDSVRNTTVYETLRDRWINPSYAIRFNMGIGALMPVLVGYLTGCTTSFTTPSGNPGPSVFDYETWLPWTINALEEYAWNLGDYRDGLVGMRDDANAVDPVYLVGNFANFSIALIAEYLMLYYDTVYPDARIPGMLQTLADYMIGQTRAATAADQSLYPTHVWTGPYICTRPAAVATPTFTGTTNASGTSVGATTNAAGYAIGTTSVTLAAAGTGSILVGDAITFAGHTRTYRVTVGVASVASGGTLTFTRADGITPDGLTTALPASATALTITGTCIMTWTGGTYLASEIYQNYTLIAPGIPVGTSVGAPVPGTTIMMSLGVTPSTGFTVSLPASGWWLAMMPSLFAWVHAYTGTALYATWRDRAADPGSMFTGMQTKNWGEWFGCTRQNYLYYANGGTVRGTPGVHPTAIVEPPAQPTLG